jgi:hypothetical protein
MIYRVARGVLDDLDLCPRCSRGAKLAGLISAVDVTVMVIVLRGIEMNVVVDQSEVLEPRAMVRGRRQSRH